MESLTGIFANIKNIENFSSIVLIRALIIAVIGYLGLQLISFFIGKAAEKNLSKQSAMLVRKSIYYFGLFIIIILILQEFKVKLSAILGAAGVFGIAIGFASQTSISNIISGIFLIGEKPFKVGDIIKVGEHLGVVLSIDLLSIKIRGFDNKFIRIPNENLIKTEVSNITRFPIRRLDIEVGVAYKEDVRRVMDILRDLANKNPMVLDEPEPTLIFKNFGDSSLEIFFGVWFVNADYVKLKNEMMISIKERFDAEGIEIPFPHRTIYAGSVTDPIPVKITNEGGQAS